MFPLIAGLKWGKLSEVYGLWHSFDHSELWVKYHVDSCLFFHCTDKDFLAILEHSCSSQTLQDKQAKHRDTVRRLMMKG